MKVSNLTPDNGGFSTVRVGSFWSLLAFGRFLFDGVNSLVSRSFDIVVVGWKVVDSAPCDVILERCKHEVYSPTASPPT